MIDEKKLVRLLKATAKSSGYNMTALDGTRPLLCLWAQDWMIRLPMEKLPRTVLDVIVEHIGRIPALGDCSTVCKDGEQALLRDTALGELQRREGGDVVATVRQMPIRYCRFQLYQSNGLRVWGVNPWAPTLIDKDEDGRCAEVLDGERMMWRDENGCLIVPCWRPCETSPEKIRAIWQALESVDLSNEE